MKRLYHILLLLLLPFLASASHMVSGYITYQWITGYEYQITFYNYANTCNDAYDQDTLTFHFSDGDSVIVARSNGSYVGGFYEGVPVCDCRKLCIYTTNYIFKAPGLYKIWVDDQARMANITNMYNSNAQNFYVYSTLLIDPFVSVNDTSPVIANPLCCVYACPGRCFYYNMGAYSPTGDSLSYALGNCLAGSGTVATGYSIPAGSSINAVTGTLQWCSPPSGGIYNYAIYINDYKRVYDANTHKTEIYQVGTIECELEIIVDSTCTNDPPVVSGPNDTCVVAGTNLTINYRSTDADHDLINLVATGQPFSMSPPATYTSTSPADPVSLTFNWNTDCSEVRKSPYPLLITATDIPASPPPLNAYQSTNIYVVGPAPTNLVAIPKGNEDSLHWNPSACTQIAGYSIYRHIGCSKWIPWLCETGVPAYTGYVLIGTVYGLYDTTFIDNNGGKGLVPGLSYDYMVVADYPLTDGSVSYASRDTCVMIKRDAPIITNVSVDSTSGSKGRIYVRWTKPLPDSANLDTLKNPGPYKYVLQRAPGINGTIFSPVVTYTVPYFRSFVDTTYKDSLLDTYATGYNYRVDFYSNSTNFNGSSPTASSIYLTVKPDNNQLHLSWASHVPWTDSAYLIYRKNPPPATVFNLIATVPMGQTTYTDTNVTNGKTYCYYVKSKSDYMDTTITHPLYDSSEVMCEAPKDTIPPCAPKLTVTAKCNSAVDSLIWNNPDHFCPKTNNILLYHIYFTPMAGTEPQLVATITNLNDTVYVHDTLNSVAGCWAVTAVDSEMYESPIDTICVDDCPDYTLPNIFTPNGDGNNDQFTPILPYRYIKDIDINIFNRWGQVVFNTIDPMIRWDGKDETTNLPCPDGVYYYICQVHEIHVTGIKTLVLKGFVQLLR